MDSVFLQEEVNKAIVEHRPLVDRYHHEAVFAAQVDVFAAAMIQNNYRGIDYFVDAAIVAVILAKQHKARHRTPEDENGFGNLF